MTGTGGARARADVFEHDGLRFDVVDRGPRGAPVVVLLHGFPGGAATWTTLTGYLSSAGYRSVAFEQRGYSRGARPSNVDAYRIDHVAGDALALTTGLTEGRVHVIGHDWGALVGWHLASQHPEAVASLVALSTPHPAAFAEALLGSSQGLRSLYALAFQLPVVPERFLLMQRGAAMRAGLRMSGLCTEWADRYADAMLEPGRLKAALNWYRAAGRGVLRGPSTADSVRVPTTFVWGSKDVSISPAAARLTARHVTAPYRSCVLDGCTHWIPELHTSESWPCIEEHLARHGTPGS